MSGERREFIEVMVSLAPWVAIVVAIIWSELNGAGVWRRRDSRSAPDPPTATRPSAPRPDGVERPDG